MGKINLNRIAIGGVSLFVVGTIALVPFTNCAQNPQSASTPETAFLSPSEQYEVLKTEFKGRVPLSFCQSSEAYGCMKRVYSVDVASAEMPARQECANLAGNLTLCPVTQVFTFNTVVAQEHCNNCGSTHEYLEYSCHLKIPNKQNIYPIVAIRPTVEQSLSELYQLCAAIAEEPK